MKIRELPIDEQPREKLIQQGARSLSDTELLAIFLRTGIRGKDVLTLSREIIRDYGGLKNLVIADHKDFTSYKGLGSAKYVQLQAGIELSRRYLVDKLKQGKKIAGSEDTKDFLAIELSSETREVFACLFLDTKHKLIDFQKMFQGSINQAQVYVREIARQALLTNASAVIIAHNHPSGNCEPSEPDRYITKQIRKALDLLEIRLLDHCIIGDGEVYSMQENQDTF